MVRIKQKPRHPEVWPPKCLVYMSCNHTSYSDIRSYFTRTKQPGMRRNRINTRGMSTLPQWKIQLPLRPRKLLIAYVTRLQPFIVGGDSFWEHSKLSSVTIYTRIFNNANLLHDALNGYWPMTTVVVSWMPIPLCTLQAVSQPWCPPRLPSSSSK